MRFAIIGDHPEAAFLAESVHRSAQHQLVDCCVDGDLAVAMTNRGIPFTLAPSHDDAILNSNVDVVVVAIRDVDSSVAMVRRASQEDVHVVAVPPDDVSTAYSFELNVLLDEGKVGIVVLTGRWYAVPGRESLAPADVERLQQIRMTLPMADEAKLQWRRQLHAIDAVCGSGLVFSRVTGMDLTGADEKVLSRTVTLAASDVSETKVPPATITFNDEQSTDYQIRLADPNGTETLLPVSLPDPATATDFGRSQTMLDQLVIQLADKSGCQVAMEQFSNTLEICQGLEKSFRRRRTVDVYFEGVSERAVFKTQMTAIGCGVLTYVIFGMLTFLVVAQVFNPPPLLLQIGRAVWIAPVVIFLLAQLLLPLTRDRATRRSEGVEENH